MNEEYLYDKLKHLENELGCPLDVLLKALRDNRLIYNGYYCESISLSCNVNNKWVLTAKQFTDTSYREVEIEVSSYRSSWWVL